MSIVVTHELYSFLFITLSGCILCAVYDFFKELIMPFYNKFLFVLFFDVIFWVFGVGFIWFCIISSNDGRLRFYQFLGCILGAILYFFSLSFVFRQIFKNIFKIIRFILKILLTPVRFLYKILLRVFFDFRKVRTEKCKRKRNRLNRKQKRK